MLVSLPRHERSGNDLTGIEPGCRLILPRSNHDIVANASVWPVKSCLLRIQQEKPLIWLLRRIHMMTDGSLGIFRKKVGLESMQIRGEWLLCEDDTEGSVIRGEIVSNISNGLLFEQLRV